MQKPEKWLKPWHVGTHLGVLIENYQINTNMTGFRWFSKIVHPCALEESSQSIERVNQLFKELHFYDYLGIQQIIMPYISAHDFKTRYDIWVWLDFGFTLHICATGFFKISFYS